MLYKIITRIEHLFRQSCRKLIKIVKEHYQDKRLNVVTDVFLSLGGVRKDCRGYLPIDYFTLGKIIYCLKLKPTDIFIDIGCGKGRVIFFVAALNIKKVIGLELDKGLVDIAQKNYNNFTLKNSPIEIIRTDATTFKFKEGTVFYMYDPFGSKKLAMTLDNIKESLNNNPRKIRIVYATPIHRLTLDNQSWLEFEGEIEGTNTSVWHNKL